jgi:hypothetical protein
MTKEDYSNRELDSHFTFVKEALERIEKQVLKTNGRVNKLERNLLVIACVVGTILLLKFPQVMEAIKLFV